MTINLPPVETGVETETQSRATARPSARGSSLRWTALSVAILLALLTLSVPQVAASLGLETAPNAVALIAAASPKH